MLACGAAAGIPLDRLVREPPNRWHPVAWFGTVMGQVERRLYRPTHSAGAVYCAFGVALGAGAGAAINRVGGASVSPFRANLCTAAATGISVGATMLGTVGRNVAEQLRADELTQARHLIASLVGREAAQLDGAAMARAVIESIGENTVDSLVAPVLWGSVFGAPGALAYRAVNTMDAMVGHRNERYERFGTASARLDDALNWVPARVTALLVATARPRAAREVLKIVRRDAPAHPSPNSGVAEAAFAAATGYQLGGVNRYEDRIENRGLLGDGKQPDPAGIDAAATLLRDVSVVLAVALLLWTVSVGRLQR